MTRIPSLDGLRALSIALVLIGHGSHALSMRSRAIGILIAIFGDGGLGVSIFFVISGYLITKLLLSEIRETGKIDVSEFYIRRAFRILPAAYALIGTVAVLTSLGKLHATLDEMISAAFFIWNYNFRCGYVYLGHLWSLSVEEQFYLLWPLSLALLGKRRAILAAAGLIAFEPLIRVGSYFVFASPAARGHIPIMLHTRADTLMFGCLAALLRGHDIFEAAIAKALRWHLQYPSIFAAFVLVPVAEIYGRGSFMLTIGWTLQGAAIALVMIWLVDLPRSGPGRLLNTPLMIRVGAMSYSLYLWQQIFLAADSRWLVNRFPINVICTFVAAYISYRFIERPFLRLRAKLIGRPSARKTEPTALRV
jgi:peptidoglycan/LPS O-acetylase OafA/YrhL